MMDIVCYVNLCMPCKASVTLVQLSGYSYNLSVSLFLWQHLAVKICKIHLYPNKVPTWNRVAVYSVLPETYSTS